MSVSQQPCMWLMVVHEADAFTVLFFVGVALGFLGKMSSRAVFHIISPPSLTMEVFICAAYNSITCIEPHLPPPADAKELLNLHHPLGFLVGIMLTLASPNHGLFLHTVQTNMEAAGLDGLHRWGITLPSSARVSHEIHEPAAAIAILYPHLCERCLGGWTIGQPVLSPVEGPSSGSHYIQLSQSVEWKFSRRTEVADEVSVQTYRDIYAVVLDQLSQLDIGANEMEGLLVMCNRSEVLGVLTTYPSHLLPEKQPSGQCRIHPRHQIHDHAEPKKT